MDSFLPPPPSKTILLNKAYVVIWTFDNPLPLPCPHGLRLTPYVWWLFTNFFGSDSFKPYINLWKLYYWVPEARTSVKLFCKQNPPLSDLFIILKTFGQNIYTKKKLSKFKSFSQKSIWLEIFESRLSYIVYSFMKKVPSSIQVCWPVPAPPRALTVKGAYCLHTI